MSQKIGLIGVPASGKSALAKELADFLTENDGFAPVGIVDDYVIPASEFIDIAEGFSGSWYLDLHISINRFALERQKAKDHNTVITCGTMIESTTYSMMNFDNRRPFIEGDEDKVFDEAKRIQASMMTMACLYMDVFRYDKVYYLNQIGPVEEDAELIKTLDRNIQASFQAFDLWSSAKTLAVDAPTIEEATKLRLDMIKGDFLESSDEGQDVQSKGSE